MKVAQAQAPHWQKARSVQALMLEVCVALVPAILVHIYWFGPGLIVNILIAVTFALISEWLMLKMRGADPGVFLPDFSAVLAAILIAFALPPLCPWWVTACAAVFAMVFAKHAFGGLGYNTFNPAMAGYAFVLVSFPTELALWSAPGITGSKLSWLESVKTTLTGNLPRELQWDSVTGATPLDQVQIDLTQGRMLSEVFSEQGLSVFGTTPWIVINLLVLCGGTWLMFRKIIRWQLPAGLLGGLFIAALVFRIYDADSFLSPWFHLLSGSTMLAAFFIITDPVTAASSNRGRLIYAASAGLLIYIIRAFGSYPDGIAFAVLFMNMLVPLINHFTIPRAYGHER